MADSPPPSFSNLIFAHYEVRRREDGAPWELGRGAMGVTYKAYDPQLRVEVALKVINPAQVGDAKTRALFLREARAAARVHHANVGTVVFLNPDPEHLFYAMEFIAGESLRDWLHSRVPLAPLMAIGLSLQIARGLEAIHREEVIHRDLKPTNLMVVRADKRRKEDDPEAWLVKIIDFGLARNVAGDVSETSAVAGTTGFRGTALYASPEQCEERRDLDGRSDLYSLGCVMWEMLVGMPPFRANVHRELLNAHVAKPPPLQQLSHLPPSLQTVVARLLMKDREARFADAGAVISALEKCREQLARGELSTAPSGVEETSVSHQATTVMPPVARPMRGPGATHRSLIAASIAALLLLGAVLGWKAGWFARVGAAGADQAKWDAPVIAILPFDAVDGGKEETRLADALTSDVTTRAGQLPATRVISRGAVMAYKTTTGGPARKRVREIDKELGGVTAVLESSVDRMGDELKINSVLYDAKTEQRLWGYTYRRDWRDVFSVEKEVPEQIARALRTRLAAARRETPEQRAGPGPTAADLYFQALPMDPFDKSRKEIFDQAVAKDPKFAEAVAESSAYDMNAVVGPDGDKLTEQETAEKMKTVEGLARRALALDPDCVAAHVVLSVVKERAGLREEAAALRKRALELAPNDLRANLFTGFGFRETQPGVAYEYMRRANAMNPDFRRMIYALYTAADRYQLSELAIRWLKRMYELTTDPQLRELITCQQLILRGEYKPALDRLRLFPRDFKIPNEWLSVPDMTLEALRGAGMFEELLAMLDASAASDDPADMDLDRAELLLRLGREEEAKAAATRFLRFQEEVIGKAKANKQPVIMGYFRLAKGLEILGRQQEAVAQLETFSQLPVIYDRFQDPWVFRNNPAALGRLAKIRARGEEIARQIQEIERTFYDPARAGPSK